MDFLLVFKGMLLQPETLERFKQRGGACYCLYPDVSFRDHGSNIWQCLSQYDCVFTTKSFHLDDESIRDHVRDIQLVRHGFDPEVHRPIVAGKRLSKDYGSDVAFVGMWSPKKEATLATLLKQLPELDLRIWGPAWQGAAPLVRSRWAGRGAYGDEVAAIYSLSKINLGLLSEAGGGVQHGDVTTARTWQIPASGGFLLHEATGELGDYFDVGTEVATFKDASDLVGQIQTYLADEPRRESIRNGGHARCHSAPYSYASAVNDILAYHDRHDR